MKKRLWRFISILLIFTLGFAGPLGSIAYAGPGDALETFDFGLGSNPYIQFENTSPSSISIGSAEKLGFRIQGTSLTGAILGDDNDGTENDGKILDLIETFAVRLTNEDTSQVETIAIGQGSLSNNDTLDILDFSLDLGTTILQDDTLYTIDFITPTVKTILNRVGQSMFIDSGDPTSNVRFEARNSSEQIVFENSDVYNVVSSGAIAVAKEFNGSNDLTIDGPTLSMDLGDVSNFDLIDRLEFRIEGKNELSVTPGTFTADVNAWADQATTYTLLNSNPYVYSVSVDLPSAIATTQTSFAIESDTDTMNAIGVLINDYVQSNNGNVYVLGYNSSDEVVGYNLFIKSIEQANPQFVFTQVQPDFVGFYDTNGPILQFVNTGVDSQGMYITGQTSFDVGNGVQNIPFFISMNSIFEQNGDYENNNIKFKSYKDEGIPDGTNFDSGMFYEIIPVNMFAKNTITLTGTINETDYQRTFYWEPNQESIQFGLKKYEQNADLETKQIGRESDIEVFLTNEYTGRMADLDLEIYNPTSAGAIALYNATLVEPETKYYETGQDVGFLITFDLADTQPQEYAGFDVVEENVNLGARFLFDNSNIALGEVEQIINGSMQLDIEPPMPRVEWFEGFVSPEYKFVVRFHEMMDEQVDLDQFTGKLTDYITIMHEDPNVDVSGVTAQSIVGYDEMGSGTPDPDNIYDRALIGINALVPRFTQLVFNATVEMDKASTGKMKFKYDEENNNVIIMGEEPGEGTIEFHVIDGSSNDQYVDQTYKISSTFDGSVDIWIDVNGEATVTAESVLSGSSFFKGITDVNGNRMVETTSADLKMETQLDSYLIGSDGNYLLNAELSLIPVDEIPQPVSGSAVKWENMVHLQSNDDGKVFGHVYPGTYLAFELSEKDDTGKRDWTSIDVNLAFPVLGNMERYTDPIQLPQHNVFGNAVRQGTTYKESLIFIETDYYDELQTAMTTHDNWELFDVLERFYIKEVDTNADGTFSLYLKPNEQGKTYTLVGKFEGEGIIEPLDVNGDTNLPYTFAVDSVSGAQITDVRFPPPTITGVLRDVGGTPLEDVFVEFKSSTGNHFATLTGDNGVFNASIIEEGTYKLVVARTDWDVEGGGMLFLDKDTGFASVALTTEQITAIEGGADPVNLGNVDLPLKNFTIQFQIDGVNVGANEYSSVQIAQVVQEGEEPPEFHVPTKTGGFDFYLPNAIYEIEEFNYGELWIEPETALSFTVPTTPTPYNIDLGDYYNAVITVQDEDQNPLEGYRIETNNQSNGWWRGSTTNAQGKAYFKFEVPDPPEVDPDQVTSALIKIQGYMYKDKWYNLGSDDPQMSDPDYEFTVTSLNDGDNKAAPANPITIRKPNFTGTVYSGTLENGDYDPQTQIKDGHLDLSKESTTGDMHDQWYNVWIDHNGDFTFSLPEIGIYKIESAGSHFSTDPATSWFEIGKVIEVIDDGNGKLVVVEPGTTLPLSEGDIIGGGMQLGPQPPNFTGYLYKTGTTPYLSSVTNPDEFYVAMLVREKGVDPVLFQFEPWRYEYRVQVNQQGYFSDNLDPSKTYEVYAVESSRGWFEFSTPVDVTVQEGYNNEVTAPVPNFNGVIQGFNGQAIENIRYGRVELESQDRSEWIGTDIDDTGNFGMALDVGTVWTIREYWYETEDPTKDDTDPTKWSHNYVRINREITITEGMDAVTLAPNFRIDLAAADLISEAPDQYENYFNANVRPVLDETHFHTKYPNDAQKAQEEYERYQFNPWEFSTWIEGKYNSQTQIIEFFTYLETGVYELMDIHGHNLNLEIGEKFTLSGAQSSANISYNGTYSSYTMTLAYETNVEGTILESGNPVEYAWVNFMRTDLDWEDYTARRWFGAKTNASGQFALNLPKDEEQGPAGDDVTPADDETTAEYKLEGYHTEGNWNGNIWEPGKWTPVGYKFQINSDGDLTDTSGELLTTIDITPNVTGEVYKIFKSYDTVDNFIVTTTPSEGDMVKVKQAWLSIWPYDKSDANYEIPWHDWEQSIWTQTDPDTGRFTLMLDAGDYIVTEASMHDFWFRPDTVFTIDSNGDLVDEADDAVENGVLMIKPEEPNFIGKAYSTSAKTTPLKWGWMMLRPADAEEHDWESTVWINTDKEGSFEFKLSDGDWKVVELGNYNFWERVNIPFTVNGSTITSSVTGFVVNGEIEAFPPEPNLQGIVKDKAGTQVETNAWLTIKPADAGEYEWENAIWTEYRLQDDETYKFKMNIDPGNYKVVEVGSYDFFYHTDIRFTVGTDGSITSTALANNLLVVSPPQPNLTGTVYGDTDDDGNDDDPIGNGWIGIARYENGVQVTMDGESVPSTDYKDEWSNMYWQHTRWTETNASGKYEMNLSVGNYQVIGVGGQGVWYQPRLEFEIEEGEITILDIQEPGPNVTITVTGVPTAMQGSSYAWLDVFQEVDGFKYFEPVEFVEEDSSNNFIFKGNLASGSYTVGFFGTENGGIEIDNGTMTVSGTTAYEVKLGDEAGKQFVEGQIKYNTQNLGQKAWIKIEGTVDGTAVTKKTQTDSDGNFKFKVRLNTDGSATTWTVTEISLKEGYLLLPDSTDYEFDSGTDTSPSTAWNFDIGSLVNLQ